MTIEKDIYQDHKNYIDNGYKDRSEYLKHLSEYYVIPIDSVCAIAEVLGTGEDFDALICELEDFEYLYGKAGRDPDSLCLHPIKTTGSSATFIIPKMEIIK